MRTALMHILVLSHKGTVSLQKKGLKWDGLVIFVYNWPEYEES
jgi:hypothetical protein